MIRRKDRGLIATFQTDHTKGNGCGFNLGNTSYTLQAVNGGGYGNSLQARPGVEQFNEEQESIFGMPRRESLPHSGLYAAESVKSTRRNGDSGKTPMSHKGECWAWKHRNLMSFPKLDVADPCTATDYKDPDLVGYEV